MVTMNFNCCFITKKAQSYNKNSLPYKKEQYVKQENK